MRIASQLRLVGAISTICLGLVILASGWQLRQLAREYQSFSAAQQNSYRLMQMQAIMLAISRADPVLPDTAERLDRAEPRRHAHQTDVIDLPREPLPPRPGYPTTL